MKRGLRILSLLAAAGITMVAMDAAARPVNHQLVTGGAPRLHPEVTGDIVYFGGHVISKAQIVLVFWGSNVTSTATTQMEPFYKAIVDSSFMDWMGEYDTAGATAQDGLPGSNQQIFRGSFLKTVTITPANTNTSITDTDIGTELGAQITSGALPTPTMDAEGGVNTLYMIHFPPGMTIDDGSGAKSCNTNAKMAFCGYHSGVTMTVAGKSASVAYAVIPDMSNAQCAQGCGTGTIVDAYTLTGSHELAEAITDTEVAQAIAENANGRPIAWYDNTNGEIADICDSADVTPAQLAGFAVQKIWSQRLGQCIASDPTLPVCASGKRPCRPCAATDEGTVCTGATPKCDVNSTSPSYGLCVGCTKNVDCSTATKPVCDTTGDASTNACRGCVSDSECAAPTSKCDPSGACVAPPTSGGSSGSSGTTSGGLGASDAGGNGDQPGTVTVTATTSGCAASPSDADVGGIGAVGLLFGLAAIKRRRRS